MVLSSSVVRVTTLFTLCMVAAWAASLSVAPAQSRQDVAEAAAEGWAEALLNSLLSRRLAPGQKLALQPLHPDDFTGLNRRQRRQLHGQLLDALARASANKQFELVDRESLKAVSRALADSSELRWREKYLQVLKEAHARINIVCESSPRVKSLVVECRAMDLHDSRALAVSSASFDLAWVNQPIPLNFAAGEIAKDIAPHVGKSGRLSTLRIVDHGTLQETDLSKNAAASLEHAIGRAIGTVRSGETATAGKAFRLEGTIGQTHFQDKRLRLRVRLLFKEGGSLLFQEYVAPSSAGPAESPSPSAKCGSDGEVAKRVLPKSGRTLGDWRLLASDRLKRGDHAQLIVEAKAHLRNHCNWNGAREVLDLAVSRLASGIRLSGKGDARRALARISEIEGSAGEHPALLELRARAHRMLGEYAQEEVALSSWLRVAEGTHPDRRETLYAQTRARAAVSDGKRFSDSLGRVFSASAKEDSSGWTDLHYAAVLNLSGAVMALVDAGVHADVRLKNDSSRFGEALPDTLVGLRQEQFAGWEADGETPLMIAAVANAHDAVEALVEAGADIRAKNASGKIPLHFAAYGGARETAEWLVEKGADIHAKDDGGRTPLHDAAWGNARETAEWLVGKGADIHGMDKYGETPLHDAARRNARETAEWLAEKGADIHSTDIEGQTPLHEAASRDARETAEWLVGKGAQIHATDIDGKTPLHLAARGNARETAEWLVGNGAHVHATDIDGRTPLHDAAYGGAGETAGWLAGRGADLRAKDNSGQTPLHLAARGNAREMAEWLVEGGADIRAKDIAGNTPLHEAGRGNARETAEWLVGKGAHIHAIDIDGRTPLHFAARGNARETAEWLVGKGADFRARDNIGSTPLHEAALGNAPETAKWLIEKGADINAKDIDGKTPLHFAARGNARATAEWLIGEDVDIRAKDANGETPLHDAARGNARETAEWLVGKGADISAKDSDGETPLHDAARRNARETAEWLVGKGADFRAKDNRGNTPLHEAAWGNARETAEWLIGKGADINVKDYGGQTPLDMTLISKRGSEQESAATRAMLRLHGGNCSRKC